MKLEWMDNFYFETEMYKSWSFELICAGVPV